MSTWYATALVLILKLTVPPGAALMSVVKPWMVSSKDSTIQFGVPVCVFSHATLLVTGAVQGAAAAAGAMRIDVGTASTRPARTATVAESAVPRLRNFGRRMANDRIILLQSPYSTTHIGRLRNRCQGCARYSFSLLGAYFSRRDSITHYFRNRNFTDCSRCPEPVNTSSRILANQPPTR